MRFQSLNLLVGKYCLVLMGRGTNSKGDRTEIIPIGILLVGLIVGGALLSNFPTGDNAIVHWTLIGLCALGVLYVGIGFKGECEKDGLDSAVNWLFNGSPKNRSNQGSSTSGSSVEKTPPAPEKLKNELYFDRADRHCEWCSEQIDTPEIHHIKPRAEGGPNKRRNLIVLCPNCHRKADGGTIGRSKLQYRVREQMEIEG